jgi:hypothetical protein
MVWMTPSKFVMRPPWDSKRSASSDFTYLKQNNVHRGSIWQIGRLADYFFYFATICRRSEAVALSGSLSSHKNLPLDDNIELFGLKIGWDVARAFLMVAALVVLPPDFLYIGGDSNHDIGGTFCQFGFFSSLKTLMI